MNILDEANKIVNERSEEKERAYGSFSEGMKRAASIASGMTGKNITADDMFQCMVALKFSRQSFNHKTDNLLDAVAYIGAWNNFIDEEAQTNYPKKAKSEFHEKLSEALEDGPIFAQHGFSEYVAEDIRNFHPGQKVKDIAKQGSSDESFKEKLEDEVFENSKADKKSTTEPLEEKLQIMSDCILALHNRTVEDNRKLIEHLQKSKEEQEKTTVYVQYLAEHLDTAIDEIEKLKLKNAVDVEYSQLSTKIDEVIAFAEYIAGRVADIEKRKPDIGDSGPN